MQLIAKERQFKKLILATAQLLVSAFQSRIPGACYYFFHTRRWKDFRLNRRSKLGSILVFVAFMPWQWLSLGG